MSILIYILTILLLGCSTSSHLVFEAPLKSDQLFVQKNLEKIKNKLFLMEQYFGVTHDERLLIQILPYDQNKDFKFCARIYGPHKIYIHSIESLKETTSQASGINEFCFIKNYNDLEYTVYHEYAHILTWRYLGHSQLPRWLWEGVAVALSGELEFSSSQAYAIKKLQAQKEVNFCKDDFEKLPPYQVVGPYLYYLENQRPGILLEMLDNVPMDITQRVNLMKKHGFPCEQKADVIIKSFCDKKMTIYIESP